MILDLLVLGLGIRMFIGAVQRARRKHPDPAGPAAAAEQPRQQPDKGTVMTQLTDVFAVKRQEFSWCRGAILAVILGLPIGVSAAHP